MINERSLFRKMEFFGPPLDQAQRPSASTSLAGEVGGEVGGQVGGADRTHIFWGEIAPCEHLVQIYKDDDVFMDALDGFVYGGLTRGDGVVIIATPEHRAALAHRMDCRGVDIAAAQARDQYIALDAEETLARFMRPMPNDTRLWPDPRKFQSVVSELLVRASQGEAGRMGRRRVRAFGEMVALLWQEGNTSATLRLEQLWHEMCHNNAFCLFCAYPRAYFTQSADQSIHEICQAHSRIVPG